MDKLKIRRYQPKDKEKVWELHEMGLAVIGVKVSRGSPWDKDVDDVEGSYFNGGDFLVGEIMGRVVAMGGFKKVDEYTAEIKRMRVHPDFQRRGFGQTILEELEKRAKKMRYKRVVLLADEINKNAINFYLKNGYKEIKREVINIRYRNFDMIWFEKNL